MNKKTKNVLKSIGDILLRRPSTLNELINDGFSYCKYISLQPDRLNPEDAKSVSDSQNTNES